MSSGSRLTLHNCEMCYYQQLIMSHDYRSKFTSGSIFTLSQWMRAYSQFINPFLIKVNIYPATLSYNISTSQYLQWVGERRLTAIFFTHLYYHTFIRVTIYPNPPILTNKNINRSLFTLQDLSPCFGL
jgi:hypothetical protein